MRYFFARQLLPEQRPTYCLRRATCLSRPQSAWSASGLRPSARMWKLHRRVPKAHHCPLTLQCSRDLWSRHTRHLAELTGGRNRWAARPATWAHAVAPTPSQTAGRRTMAGAERLLFFVLVLAWPLLATSQVYRCGNSYQSTPCAGGRVVVDTSAAPTRPRAC